MWYWVVLVVTLIYLVVETSFSSELLNIVGQNASTSDITSIEHWGRCISGFALGLILWSFLTPSLSIFGWRPFRTISRAMLVNIVVTLCTMAFVYHWEMQIVQTAKADNSGTRRKEAVYAAFVRTGLLNHTVVLDGMSPSTVNYSAPEGKAFIALLPLLADSDGNLSAKVHGVLKTVLEDNALIRLHGPQGFYDRIFLPSAHHMDSAWTQYQGMVSGLNAAYQRANSAPYSERSEIVATADANFHTAFRKAFSINGYPPADVNPVTVHDAQEFFALPAITRFWGHSIRLSGSIPPMMPNESYSSVRATVWPVFLADTADKELQTFQSNTSAFRDGGVYARQGKDAVVLLTVPAMALILSVIGMLIHSTKVLYYLQKVIQSEHGHLKISIARTAPQRMALALLVSGGTACLFYFWSNGITQATLYHHLLSEYSKNGHGMWPAWMLTWIIQAERLVYPIADFLRQHLLLGCHFGVHR